MAYGTRRSQVPTMMSSSAIIMNVTGFFQVRIRSTSPCGGESAFRFVPGGATNAPLATGKDAASPGAALFPREQALKKPRFTGG